MYIPSIFRPAPVRKRLWQGAIALTLLTLIFGMMNVLLPAEKRVTGKMLGHDFLAFYTAGTFVRTGHAADLYDLEKIKTFEHAVGAANGLDMGASFGPWWNPPHYAWLFVPLSSLPFPQAVAIWTAMNLLALMGAVLLLIRMLAPEPGATDAQGRDIDWRTTGLVPLLLLLSMPFVQAISHGQSTFGSLFLLAATVTLWRKKRMLMAGACCGLLSYKPQLAVVLAGVLVIDAGVRALIGLSLTGSFFVLVTQFTLPGTLVMYLRKLPENVHFMQVENAYLWERHATLKGFWRLLLQGRDAGEPWMMVTLLGWASVAVLGLALAWVTIGQRLRRGAALEEQCWTGTTDHAWRERLIAATVCAMPLLMPFYFDYDLLLLAVPATLYAGERLRQTPGERTSRHNYYLTMAWCALYLYALVNPGLARETRLNGSVILLTIVAGLSIARAARRDAKAPAEACPSLEKPPLIVTIRRRAA